ncbi:hypothetical protein A3I27_01745 [Candidatus Giovannonibacteria bacterium RIFCSPLOWO2_02_FULL_43_11b]|uniref:Translation elongation factor-like protein n=1 Tax=Candidatus Giovannonibacteria bacterium RIFCSPHIGHO2_12_FULL_43_15 TaxID=1798341 RepID=A0A1F5WNN4_9BACT|nr:MAG: hypothetical protein A3B97_02840 [Candidatus Giovannonibacteria bacterium RIFCSPHIGHO2_02_FULL_43_32]OGF77214.1 MAG: hypothetical protein A3F23_01870 [Candidatus Giovannonibacteria bacterium RIFCSPHIGHO2_12_FULL_43_15]OGF90586.1 MAG: hypothetical protein A3I27_01745 [Candidatus Giovannonibacteria bacterium RIFCSPLOWO2_02_FULL_43_11b]OGF92247.1 MAG: hypothetical protein A3H04_03090 [Candidatus Giovannonibacteria bacterium RIFCSPLOWO2_12_FULL_43_11c]
MADEIIGKVTHFYDKLGVAVVKLTDKLSTGDKIKVVKGDNEFTDVVVSMQINQESVSSAKAGEEVAVMISKVAKEGSIVYKID